jgi:hypothetical protein
MANTFTRPELPMFRRSLAVAALIVGVASAAPVPKAPPPPSPKSGATIQLATAKVNGEAIQISQQVSLMEVVMVPEVVQQNGQQVTVYKQQVVQRQMPQTVQMPLKGTKASTADGKEIAEDDLAKKLGDGAAVVQVPPGFDPEWKKVFADDVIFLEANPAALPGGGRLAPLPAPAFPGGGPVPVPAVAPPAIEKK